MKVLAVTNMYPTQSDPASGTFVEQQVAGLRKIGVNVGVLFIDRRTKGMAAYLRVPTLVKEKLAAFEPDVVHVMYGGVMADLVTSTVQDRPTVVTFHGSDLLGEQAAWPVRKWIAAYGVRSSHRAARRATGIIVVAEALRQRLVARQLSAWIRLIPCGIDFERFRPLDKTASRQALSWPRGAFHVLFNAGGSDPVKRPALARAAIARLNEMGIPAQLHEMRGVANDQVAVWLNASDVLLLTSLHEGSPTIVKEALACNLPVVSLDVGDVRDRIRGIDGCYLATADAEDLSAKLRLVCEDGRRLQAREKILDLSSESTAAKLRDFYDALLDADATALAPAAAART